MRAVFALAVLIGGCREREYVEPSTTQVAAKPAPSPVVPPLVVPTPPTPSSPPPWKTDCLTSNMLRPFVDDGVDWYRPDLRRCLPATCTAHVGVEFEISIATDGTVDDVKTLSGETKLTKCMERVLRKWGYPKSDCPQKERRPFAFVCESGRWRNH